MKKLLVGILIFLTLLFSVLLYSRFFGVKGLKTNEIIIKDDIPSSYDGLKIVHFSDLHYKKVITEKEIKNLIKEIKKIKPDIVLFTGDLADDDYKLTNQDINFLIQELSKIETKYGSYAVLGDQDNPQRETIHNIYIQSNFTLLENDSTIIQNESNDKILLVGVSSFLNKSADILKAMDGNYENISYQIILIHEPDYTDTILKNYSDVDLILSSHSINGSINIPIVKKAFLPDGAKKYYQPYYKINDTNLYISNGIGVDRVNFRLFNTPSINFYRLKRNN